MIYVARYIFLTYPEVINWYEPKSPEYPGDLSSAASCEELTLKEIKN